ncbi:YbhB/YbcL family Raf kinase inhibitor-like protein [Pleomorphomonas oryzae]|uniref:YbhB/YbcL family Raf kinase inhibitor-like protein n=1 Tax=Pleomorphomonas oryzae TaxID=261934 RepID=UPI0003FF78F7|nr:YbhB/YbcL family Raf kinase inhibitor-like protein [Pleomorphomonas oryzae]
MKTLYRLSAVAFVLLATASLAAAADRLTVTIDGLDASGRFADDAAFCPPATSAAKDVSPAVSWSAGPAGTRSYALTMTDPDVPRDLSLINKPGTTIDDGAPRVTIHHWVLADIPANITALKKGAEGDTLTPHGKPIGDTDHGRRGANVFTGFLASNPDMAGTYGGYDGPCPPMNDERRHHYTIRVYALDVPTLGLSGAFNGAALEKAVEGHVLAQGEAIATYSLNPKLTTGK